MRRHSINQAEATTALGYLLLTQKKFEGTTEVCRARAKTGERTRGKWRRKR